MSATRIDLRNLASDGTDHIETLSRFLVLFNLLLVFRQPHFHGLDRLRLLADGDLIAALRQNFDIRLQHVLGEPNNMHRLTWRHDQVHVLAADRCILVVDDEPARPPIQEDAVEVFRLAEPEALHTWRHFLPLGLGNEYCAGVVVRVIRPVLLRVHNVFIVRKPRTFLFLLDLPLSIAAPPVRPHV